MKRFSFHPLALLLLAHPVEDEKLLSALRPHMREGDIHALAEVKRAGLPLIAVSANAKP